MKRVNRTYLPADPRLGYISPPGSMQYLPTDSPSQPLILQQVVTLSISHAVCSIVLWIVLFQVCFIKFGPDDYALVL